jgi:hypothetical protein
MGFRIRIKFQEVLDEQVAMRPENAHDFFFFGG